MGTLEDKVVVVTGASAGIGRATAQAFAREGARVALLARGEDRLESARQEVIELGGDAVALAVDVARHADVERAASEIERRWGTIDVWVNNAMVTTFTPVGEISPEDFQRVTDVTYHGTVWGTMAALARMRQRDAGTIIQVGSALAYRSIPLQSAYCGAKSAVRAFTDSLRCELIHDRSNIRLSMVQIAAFNTPQFDWARTVLPRRLQPLPPIFQPEIAAEAIVHVARYPRREMWVGWPTVQTILGQRFAAPLLDHYLAHAAWSGQQDDEPLPAQRVDNLHAAPPGDPGAHGRFDDRARSSSLQLWFARNRAATVLLGLLSATALGASLRTAFGAVQPLGRAARSGGRERHRR
jgi:NAD(P)-dependent dehydrogenase (short-subunit alcohol dehydrogenase family)